MAGTFFPLYYQWVLKGTKQISSLATVQSLSASVPPNLHHVVLKMTLTDSDSKCYGTFRLEKLVYSL